MSEKQNKNVTVRVQKIKKNHIKQKPESDNLSAPAFTIYCVDSFNTTSYGRSVLFSVSSPSICLSRFLQALAPSSFESNESDVMDGTLFSSTELL